jgi:hypothetical protein
MNSSTSRSEAVRARGSRASSFRVSCRLRGLPIMTSPITNGWQETTSSSSMLERIGSFSRKWSIQTEVSTRITRSATGGAAGLWHRGRFRQAEQDGAQPRAEPKLPRPFAPMSASRVRQYTLWRRQGVCRRLSPSCAFQFLRTASNIASFDAEFNTGSASSKIVVNPRKPPPRSFCRA